MTTPLRLVSALLAACFASLPSAHADLRTESPAHVTEYLSIEGLSPLGGWKHYAEVGWVSASDYLSLPAAPGGPQSPPNTLAYYCLGTESRVTEVRLVLTLLSKYSETEHTGATAKVAARLCQSATGQPLPQEMRNAILARRPWTAKHGGYTLKVNRSEHSPKPGYTLTFSIRISEG